MTDELHIILIKKVLLSCLFVLCTISLPVYAEKASDILRVSEQAPPGFDALTAPQSTLVDVYFQGNFLGITKATVDPDFLQFQTPSKVVNLLGKKIVNKVAVRRALTGKLVTNTGKLCDQVRRSGCNVLFPKVAGIIYDPANFRVQVFVNSRFMPDKTKTFWQPLPDSSAGFSYVNQLYAVTSNTTGKNGYNDYNFSSNNTWAYKNTRFNLSSSYANNLVGATSLQVNDANLEIVNKQRKYIFGIMDTTGNDFFANQTIIGGEFKTTLDTIPNAADGVGTPINISLNFPSQVSVYKEGKLIYTGQYEAGNQFIDTTHFPTGSYPIVIKISSSQGASREITRFFVKTEDIPPLNMPQYYASFGYLMADRQFDSGVFAEVLSIPVYQAGANIRLSSNWGLNMGVLGTDRDILSTVGAIYLQEHWRVEPALLLGVSGDVGYSGTASYQSDRFSSYANIAQIWCRDCRKRIGSSPTTSDYYHRFLNNNRLQVNANVSYQFDKSSLAFYAALNDRYSGNSTHSYGPSFTTELWRRHNTIVNFNLSASKSESDSFILATMRASFVSPPVSSYGSLGYNAVHNYDDSDLSGAGLSATAAIDWNYMDATQNGYNFGIRANSDPVAHSIGASYDYQNNRMKINLFGDYNNNRVDGSFMQYGGSVNTHVVYAASSTTVSGGSIDGNNGLLVQATSEHKDDIFDLYVDTRMVKHLQSGQKTFVPLEPYASYKVNIINESSSLYHFDKPERIVTIYPGNVEKITWHAIRKYILVGRLIMPDKKPLPYVVIHGGVGYNVTDENGYFQIEAKSNVNRFTVGNGRKCEFNVLPVPMYNNFSYIGDVVCHARKGRHVKSTK